MPQLIIVLENLRSCHNVGSILRSADGFNQRHFIFLGTTPYPKIDNDQRLPHQITKQTAQINKTALGAEQYIQGQYFSQTTEFLSNKRAWPLVCLEQTDTSQALDSYRWREDIYLVVGNEINGVSSQLLQLSNCHLAITMKGRKESFNVAVASALALYQLQLAYL